MLSYAVNPTTGFYWWTDAVNKEYLSTIHLAMDLPLPNSKLIVLGSNAYKAPNPNTVILIDKYNLRDDIYLGKSIDITQEINIYNELQEIKRTHNNKKLKAISDDLNLYSKNGNELIACCETLLLINTLKKINNVNVLVASSSALSKAELFIKYLNKHNLTKVTTKGHANYNVRQLHKVMQSFTMANYSQDTIDDVIKPFKDALKKYSTKSGILLDTNSPVYIILMDIINQIGKKNVGPSANGLKTYFANSLYYNNVLENLDENIKITDTDIYALRAYTFSYGDGTRIRKVTSTLADTKVPKNIKEKYIEAYHRLAPDMAHISDLNFTRNNASNLFSALLSLAVDNAKELALGKMNASTALISMHIALLSLGYSVEELVRITTSPVFEKLVEATTVKIEDGLLTKSRLNIKVFDELIQKAESYEEAFDILELQKLYMLGNEITQEALIFGINLGLSSNPEEILKAKDKIETGLNLRSLWFIHAFEYNYNSFDAFINELCKYHGIDTPEYRNYLNNKINSTVDFAIKHGIKYMDLLDRLDMSRFFNDSAYQKVVIDMYDVLKQGVNIYAALVNNPHYYQMYYELDGNLLKIYNSSFPLKFLYKDGIHFFNPNLINNQKTYADVNLSGEEIEAYGGELEAEKSLNSFFAKRNEKSFKKSYKYSDLASQVLKIYNQYLIYNTLKKLCPNTFTITDNKGKEEKINLLYGNGQIKFILLMTGIIGKIKAYYETNDLDNGFLNNLIPNNRVYLRGDIQPLFSMQKYWNVLVGQSKTNITAAYEYENILTGYKSFLNINKNGLIKQLGFSIENTNLQWDDLWIIYTKLISAISSTPLLNFDSLHKSSEILTKYDKEEIEMSRAIKREGKIEITQDIFNAGLYADKIRLKEKNRVVKFSYTSGYDDIDLDNTVLLFSNSASKENVSMQKALQLKHHLENGNITITYDKDNFYILYNDEPQEFVIKRLKSGELSNIDEFIKAITSEDNELIRQDLLMRLEMFNSNKRPTKWITTLNSSLESIKERLEDFGIKCVIEQNVNRENPNIKAKYENGTIVIYKPALSTSSTAGVALHELSHLFLGYLKEKSYIDYVKFLTDTMKPFITEVKDGRYNSFLETILHDRNYANMLELDQYEEAFAHFLEAVINGDLGSDAELVSKDGIHFYQALEELRSLFNDLFGITDYSSVFDLMQSAITQLPKIWTNAYKEPSHSFTNAIVEANKARAIGGYVRNLLSRNVLIKVDC